MRQYTEELNKIHKLKLVTLSGELNNMCIQIGGMLLILIIFLVT